MIMVLHRSIANPLFCLCLLRCWLSVRAPLIHVSSDVLSGVCVVIIHQDSVDAI